MIKLKEFEHKTGIVNECEDGGIFYLNREVDNLLEPLRATWERWKLQDDPALGIMCKGYYEFYDAVKKVME